MAYIIGSLIADPSILVLLCGLVVLVVNAKGAPRMRLVIAALLCCLIGKLLPWLMFFLDQAGIAATGRWGYTLAAIGFSERALEAIAWALIVFVLLKRQRKDGERQGHPLFFSGL